MIKFVFFADKRWQNTMKLLASSLKCLCKESEIVAYSEYNLPSFLNPNLSQIMSDKIRGFGYWSWKAPIVLDVLEKSKENDIICYIDAGFEVNSSATDTFWEYVHESSANNILAFRSVPYKSTKGKVFNPQVLLNGQWCKGDLLDHFNVRHNNNVILSPSYGAGLFFAKRCDLSRDLILEWYNTYNNNIHLIDDSQSLSPNLPFFIEHRHDQSIFSLICTLKNIPFRSSLEYHLKPNKLVSNSPMQIMKMMNLPFYASRKRPASITIKGKLKKLKNIFKNTCFS